MKDHDFIGVAGQPDDNECTHRSDGTDATYCGRSKAAHDAAAADEDRQEPRTAGSLTAEEWSAFGTAQRCVFSLGRSPDLKTVEVLLHIITRLRSELRPIPVDDNPDSFDNQEDQP